MIGSCSIDMMPLYLMTSCLLHVLNLSLPNLVENVHSEHELQVKFRR